MKIKFIQAEDFVNYKKCSMFIGAISCTWKCCKEQGLPCEICQNYSWSRNQIKDIPNEQIIDLYLNNFLTSAIVFGGLEPLDEFAELLAFIDDFRKVCDDDIVIYTGYNKEEIVDKITQLADFKNIIIKFGRYVPNRPSRYDEILGITLVSDNQYAEKIS